MTRATRSTKQAGKEAPTCDCCAGLAHSMTPGQLKRRKELQEERFHEIIDRLGYGCHWLTETDENGFRNAHTHGLREKSNHPDFQIVFPLPSNISSGIFHDLATKVQAGTVFEADKNYDKIIRNFPVRMIEATECGRKVLRVIFPDPHGNIDRDKMQKPYDLQYTYPND